MITGRGQANGKLITRISNNYYSSDIDIVHMELIPWFCRVYIHTLKITNSKKPNVNIGKFHKKIEVNQMIYRTDVN